MHLRGAAVSFSCCADTNQLEVWDLRCGLTEHTVFSTHTPLFMLPGHTNIRGRWIWTQQSRHSRATVWGRCWAHQWHPGPGKFGKASEDFSTCTLIHTRSCIPQGCHQRDVHMNSSAEHNIHNPNSFQVEFLFFFYLILWLMYFYWTQQRGWIRNVLRWFKDREVSSCCLHRTGKSLTVTQIFAVTLLNSGVMCVISYNIYKRAAVNNTTYHNTKNSSMTYSKTQQLI